MIGKIGLCPSVEMLLSGFLQKAAEDPRINPYHISIYAALIVHWSRSNFQSPLQLFSRDIMPLCKISGSATYHRTLRDLHEFGYLRYEPSFNHFAGSLVYFKNLIE